MTMENRTTVFYVDDNPRSSRLLTSVLEGCGFRVIPAHDPVEALGRPLNEVTHPSPDLSSPATQIGLRALGRFSGRGFEATELARPEGIRVMLFRKAR